MKSALLFLCHRIPYPPNKGDKIRSFHLLKNLASRYRVFLGAFVDDPLDWEYAAKLNDWCESVQLFALNPKTAKLRSLKGLEEVYQHIRGLIPASLGGGCLEFSRAFSFIAKAASTYMRVAVGLSCPSHNVMVLMSTPDSR